MSKPRPARQAGRDSGRRVVVLGVVLALCAVAFDLSQAGELTMFFDLAFVTLCLALAVAVKPHDFFTVGVLPPFVMAGLFAVLGGVQPASVGAAGDGVLQATISGLAHHSAALVSGYLICLGTLAFRRRRLGLPLETGEVVEEEAQERGAAGALDVTPPETAPEMAPETAPVSHPDAAREAQAASNRLASPAP